MKNVSKIGVIMLGILIGFTACKKNELLDEVSQEETQMSTEELSQSAEEDANLMTMQKHGGGSSGSACQPKHHLPSCAVVTDTMVGFPKTIIIDFGAGCAGPRGRVKKGKILITLTDSMFKSGAKRTVTFDNFSVNDKGIAGSIVLENTGLNSSGNNTFSRDVDIDVTTPKGLFEHVKNGDVEWIEGFGSGDCLDNVFLYSGTGSTTGPNGGQVSSQTISPLRIERDCKYITAGELEITKPNGDIVSIDFGAATCDDVATVTKNGTTKTIDLDDVKFRRLK